MIFPQCFSVPFSHLSFSRLTPSVPHPVVSVSVCSPPCLVPHISLFRVHLCFLCLPPVSFPVSPSVSPSMFLDCVPCVCFCCSVLCFCLHFVEALFCCYFVFLSQFGLRGLFIFVCHSALVKINSRVSTTLGSSHF